MKLSLGFTWMSLQSPIREHVLAARELFDAIAEKFHWLKSATHDPESFRAARIEIHSARDRYHRARGSGHAGQLICLADLVCSKLSEIVNLNPGDWNNYRRGQQFRRLNSLLIEFDHALRNARSKSGLKGRRSAA